MTTSSWAKFSSERVHRYALWRTWDIACSEKGMSRQAWARVKETLPRTQEVKFEGDYVYYLK